VRLDFNPKEKAEEEKRPEINRMEESKIETNLGAVFPGINLDIALEELVSNPKKRNSTCSDKKILFVEKRQSSSTDSDDFHFVFSPDKKDYSKCKYPVCSAIGIIDKVYCVCGKISYCSEKCCDKDQAHIDQCEELKRREFDPQYLKF